MFSVEKKIGQKFRLECDEGFSFYCQLTRSDGKPGEHDDDRSEAVEAKLMPTAV